MAGSLRLLHVVGSSKFGGGSAVVLALGEVAREHGLEVDVLTTDPLSMEMCRRHGLGVMEFHGIDRPVRPCKDYRTACRLAKAIRGRYDVVHTHTTKGGVIGRTAAHKAGIPAILHTVHGFSFHEFSPWWFVRFGSFVERRMARRCDRLIFVNDHDRQWAIKRGIARPEQCVTVYNSVQADRLDGGRGVDRAELLQELGLPEDVILAVFVGRLAPQKGISHLLEAMALVRQRPDVPRVHLAMAGEGELRAEIERNIRALGISDRVHLLGFRRDCMRWTGGCDLFVLSSLWEGHSITLLEAMGLGRPVVATDIKGNRETITHEKDGLLVKPANAQSLAEGIIRLARDRTFANRLGTAALRTFNKHFTEQAMKRKSWEVYECLFREKGLF